MTTLGEATKDELILAMLAAMGGETRDVNERDLFLAAWHAFPNAMRWVDTPLPNPDTFTAALRRLDQKGLIVRTGKQQRAQGRRRSTRRSVVDPGRSGVVKARVADGAPIDQDLARDVRRLVPSKADIEGLSDSQLITICAGLRVRQDQHVDEGVLVELGFHKFASRFAYSLRPEFPDVQAIRTAVAAAQSEGLLDPNLRPAPKGEQLVDEWQARLQVQLDASQSHEAGDLVFAGRIEKLPGFRAYEEQGTLVLSKPDELFRALRVPPTADPDPVAESLIRRVRALRRVDKSAVVDYLVAVAAKHNADVLARARAADPELFVSTTTEAR